MLITILLLLAGFVVLIKGADYLVSGASSVAKKYNISNLAIGLTVVSFGTSLPELITAMSSVAIVNAPNLAAADVFGSCVFNLFILSILDVLLKKPISSLVRSTHVFAGSCGIILITLCGLAILLSDELPVIGWISVMTPIIFIVYFITIWLIFKFENKNSQTIFQISKSVVLEKI